MALPSSSTPRWHVLASGAARDAVPEREREALRRASARMLAGEPAPRSRIGAGACAAVPYMADARAEAERRAEEARVSARLRTRAAAAAATSKAAIALAVAAGAQRAMRGGLGGDGAASGGTRLAISLYRAEIAARSVEAAQLRAEKYQLGLEGRRLRALRSLERSRATAGRIALAGAALSGPGLDAAASGLLFAHERAQRLSRLSRAPPLPPPRPLAWRIEPEVQRGPSAQHQISNLPPEQQHAAFWDGRVSTGAGVDMAGGADGGAGRLASRVALRTGLATTILVEGDSDDAAARSDASLGTGSASTRTASESEQGSNACAPARSTP
ncbi:hypothetical protein KFE25_013656 [Diacronema lutheri]|uniref:Uncharacterized protein n=1 Tax=Diacronema lutheri TaxID=2081491 RepID=A0A8J5XJ24_DIALT|nr:hypothetical protein KFE25_013656 [Diacronema lutheri]